ncbi:MAG: lysophospholipid acyltransferase family protein [Pseudomonadota bacterium]
MTALAAPATTLPLWLRALSRMPLPMLYGLFGLLAWIAFRVLRIRLPVVLANIRSCFPEKTDAAILRIARAHYRQLGEMAAEIIRSARLSPQQFLAHVTVRNIELPRGYLAQQRPLLLVAAHQANWEWVLQAMALQLGYPLDVGYKPIRSQSIDRAMNAIRTRFGAHLVPAKDLLADLLQRRHIVRGIAMLADQEPLSSDHQRWVTFLGRDTAFYMGPEQMARATRYHAVFVALRRVSRGNYEVEFMPLADSSEQLAFGEFTNRYARLVEQEIRAAPGDWTWGHRRWKLKRGVYAD